MAVWCDEGVFAVAADVYLHETEQFKDLLLCLGPFHWTRILLRCQGKLLRGSGLDDALVECGVFGRGVIESALNGTHYVRALTGMLIVEDLIRSLQWQMFWQHKDQTAYPELEQVQALQTSLAANTRCPDEFETLTGQVEKLHQDFVEFEKECEAKSELCQFFGVWLRMVAVIKNAVVSDREGNWDLYVATVEDSMPIFAEFNCTNYQRYGSWYLEQIKVLEFTHPELYRRFSMGLWVVKDRPGWFCAVGGDMKVEQTIQRVSKGPGDFESGSPSLWHDYDTAFFSSAQWLDQGMGGYTDSSCEWGVGPPQSILTGWGSGVRSGASPKHPDRMGVRSGASPKRPDRMGVRSEEWGLPKTS
ncbi:hypothetical protein ACOMHN_066285 [Nucella lapillus]